MPQLLIFALDDWLGNQLRAVADERGWTLRECRRLPAFQNAATEARPRVAILQWDRNGEADLYAVAAELRRTQPETPVVVVSDTKVSDDAKTEWTARWLDLGVRYVAYPPLTRALLEDALDGLVRAAIPMEI